MDTSVTRVISTKSTPEDQMIHFFVSPPPMLSRILISKWCNKWYSNCFNFCASKLWALLLTRKSYPRRASVRDKWKFAMAFIGFLHLYGTFTKKRLKTRKHDIPLLLPSNKFLSCRNNWFCKLLVTRVAQMQWVFKVVTCIEFPILKDEVLVWFQIMKVFQVATGI